MRPIAAPAIQPAGSVSCVSRIVRQRVAAGDLERRSAPRAGRGTQQSSSSERHRAAHRGYHGIRCAASSCSWLACLALSAAAPPAAQDLHYGMNTRVLTAPMADKMSELGAGVVRLAFGWDVIEPGCKGCFNWDDDRCVARRGEAHASHDLRVAGLRAGVGQRRPPVSVSAAELSGLVRLRVRDGVALSRRHLSVGRLERAEPRPVSAGRRSRVYRSLVITARAAIRAAESARDRARAGRQLARRQGRLVRRGDERLRRSLRHRHRPLVRRRSRLST